MKQLSLFGDELLAAKPHRHPVKKSRGLGERDRQPAPIEDLADRRQRAATDPQASVWVGASAGTGKTKVLTDRALRLMLSGTPPSKILCLTFTKAAAAEMASRIALVLGGWTNAAEPELDAALLSLMGRAAKERERQRARSLFPSVLDAPGGLKVLTIHAFCQSLLGRFPLEAGVAPHFSVMDERDAAEALAEVGEALLLQAQDGDGPVPAAFATVTAHLQETAFRSLMQTLACARDRLAGCLAHYGSAEGATAALRRRLGIEENQTADGVIERACGGPAFDAGGLRGAAEALVCGSNADQERSAAIAAWLAASIPERVVLWNEYCRVFLTKATGDKPGCVRKTLITKACAGPVDTWSDILAAEGERLLAAGMRRRAALCADTSGAVLTLAETLLDAYRRYKAERALLDYDDLIEHAAALLEQDGGAAWVLYKLDGGIDHVLIDEAQDTSPQQWRVVRALTAEFFTGQGRADTPRTVFAVGDVKQSIFSFQGADPSLFLGNGQRFEALSAAAKQRWDRVDLTVSFRSTKAVLAAVDAVFRLDGARDGVALDGAPIRHDASTKRAGDGGLVEVWAPLRAKADDEPEPWRPPVERVESDSPARRLARVIAKRIGGMLRSGEILASKGRPVRPEDILVLVRRRTSFVEELVRALKGRGIPVAGVDRMVLSEQIAVMDLIALGRFALLPDDDLNLASLLKSPLVGFDEDDLFALAHGRKTGLWAELRRRQEERPAFARAYLLLAGLLGEADTMPPFEFYSRALGPLGGRRKLLGRLGQDADDPIAEFLDLALDYERRHPPSLQGFLHWFEAGEAVVKRDLEQAPAAVRIMTVHGAKGLQAPIVFLPDTMQVPRGSSQGGVELLWTDPGHGVAVPLWAPAANGCEEVAAQAREQAKAERLREYRRLLYVAMTRAEDRLVVCGWIGKTKEDDECWYWVIRRGLEAAADEIACERTEDQALAADPDFDAEPAVLRLSCPQLRPVEETPAAAAGLSVDLPSWALRGAAEERALAPLVPSSQSGVPLPIRSAEARESAGLRRGRLIHTLLQWLPEVAASERRRAASAWLARAAADLDPAGRSALIDEVVAVLDHPDHAALFAPGSLAEVPLGGVIGERLLSAQVDRLVVTDDAVMIVDYKTDRPAPSRPEAVPARYLAQMAAYRAALRLIYPGKPVACALLFSDLPALMLLPEPLLDRHAP
jgi:ATP-dependent helicase/nuclease subunit A